MLANPRASQDSDTSGRGSQEIFQTFALRSPIAPSASAASCLTIANARFHQTNPRLGLVLHDYFAFDQERMLVHVLAMHYWL